VGLSAGIGAAALLTAAALGAGGCINSVEVPGETGGDARAIHVPYHVVVPAQGGSAGWEEAGGNFAGGIGDDWEDYPSEGGGGMGGYDSGGGAGGAG